MNFSILGAKIEYPNFTLHELFDEIALRFSDNIALEDRGKQTTYSELRVSVNKMANFLSEKGVSAGDIVAISMNRSPELVVSLLAVMQCGAAYVPIEATYPQSRKDFMVTDSGARFYITDNSEGYVPSNTTPVFYKHFLSCEQSLKNQKLGLKVSNLTCAYIIYTSGSTGVPKGVQIAHKGLANLIYSAGKQLDVNPSDKFFSLTTISFDPMVMELYVPLLHGACIDFVDEETRLDGRLLLEKARRDKVTAINGTPSIWQSLLDAGWEEPLDIKILCGGEALTKSLSLELLKKCRRLFNLYGPTEITVCCFMTEIFGNEETISIGRPLANVQGYFLDENKQQVEQGMVGEIAIGGDGVAIGYLNRPELNEQKFLKDEFSNIENAKLYFTGDLGRLLADGNVEFIGRKDSQVKIRGHRIELGEVEVAISQLREISKAHVIVQEYQNELRLIAYIQSSNEIQDSSKVRLKLQNELPDFLIPSLFIWVDDFPRTINGKIDQEKLPSVQYQRPVDAPILRKPKTILEKQICKVWCENLGFEEIGIDDNFFDLGGTSLIAQKTIVQLRKVLNSDVAVIKLYQFPTIAQISLHLQDKVVQSSKEDVTWSQDNQKKLTTDVAIIGMAGRFPGAESIDDLWEILQNGKETISFFSKEELDFSIPSTVANDERYVPARGIVPSAKFFDYNFFGLNPKLAETMDPQLRLLLEVCWEALEHAGVNGDSEKSIGIYGGVGSNSYYRNNILPNKELLTNLGMTNVEMVNDKDYVATRTAYHLNLEGPAVSVHSACSTSLLAISQAVDAIRNGHCKMALAGGSSVTAPMNSGHLYQEGAMFSSDGHCKPFDAKSTGTMFSDGAGVVLLKSLEEAKRDGDFIHAVIKGVGVNNDGSNKASFTAPSVEGQARAIKSALKDANLKPEEISYIEAHGTATPLGDPIEFEGLQTAFRSTSEKGYCAIGSIKSNMGHLTAAAGVAGVIKTVLALKNQKIPPSLGFEKSNPAINFESSPFFLNNQLMEWNSNGVRRAGVSSFGVGGTNVHTILEEYIEDKVTATDEGRPFQILTWSAKSEYSQTKYGETLERYFSDKTNEKIADIAYSLNSFKNDFAYRSFIVDSNEGFKNSFGNGKLAFRKTNHLKQVGDEMIFLFPGQGAQFLGMGQILYQNEPEFKKAVDKCSHILQENAGINILEILYPETLTEEGQERLNNTRYAQPALFVIEYALSQLWKSWGIEPTVVCGHSVGEFVAAHLAGIFTLEDALKLVAIRGKLVSELPRGSMLSVRLSASELKELLPDSLNIGASNSNKLSVVSSSLSDIEAFAGLLSSKGIAHKVLPTSHAFHSHMMDPIVPQFKKYISTIHLTPPQLKMVSTVTGEILSDEEAISPDYWADHLRETVHFDEASAVLLSIQGAVMLEMGPGQALTSFVKQQKAKFSEVFPVLSPTDDQTQVYRQLLSALGNVWLSGFEIDWKTFYKGQERKKVPLPTYVFDRKPCWIEPLQSTANQSSGTAATNESLKEPRGLQTTKPMRKNILFDKLKEIVNNTAGIEIEADERESSFLELGLDSLILTQVALACKNEFQVPLTFRQLNEECASPVLLIKYLDEHLPEGAFQPKIEQVMPSQIELDTVGTGTLAAPSNSNQQTALSLIAQQLQLLGQQINLLQGNAVQDNTRPVEKNVQSSHNDIGHTILNGSNLVEDDRTEEEKKEHAKPFGASPKIERKINGAENKHQSFLDDLIQRYVRKTAKSKAYTQKHRGHMSDPRVVSGFKPETKEITYSLVVNKSKGSRLWDIDGNEYLDALNGFGSCYFGHQPDFIAEALKDQIDAGYEVGPQHPLAGEVSQLLCELTGHERAALCNTGSEAVLGAMRISRTVTGRSLIVAFSRSYHGINDEGIVRGTKKLKTFPAAAGIMPNTVENMLILDYGTEESLQIIKERAHELAAVLVEPVQSRRPEFRPIIFLKEVRKVTQESGAVLIFDEVITGFRSHLGGAQALFGIKADLATYGKVIGGGMSVGAIVGKRSYMDALDGGYWSYGDDSFPEVGVTYFAGTFVRHPLALAACKASLAYLKQKGPALQEEMNKKTDQFVFNLNERFTSLGLPITIHHFSSLWRLTFTEEIPFSELLFVLLREKGIHIWDGFPCFLTEAYAENDIKKLTNAILDSVNELIEEGILSSSGNLKDSKETKLKDIDNLNSPPITGARLGRDEKGNPAWYVPSDDKEGEYVKIEI
ncbi:polyketide synthase [Euzebyella marina]|uniref:polyketide synthase n=1 Tax=Euzebyella marina TaxID=1761453 RepID=UPI001786A54A|nr:polyketide synthase [Euzebyella marina]